VVKVYSYRTRKDGSQSKRSFLLATFAIASHAYEYADQLRNARPSLNVWYRTVKP
jgi:hypothetical protein